MLVTYRRGTIADSHAVFGIFERSILDLSQRLGVTAITGGDDPAVLDQLWQRRRPLFEHLARTAEHFWVAESGSQIIGYARSIVRDGLQELTEFFVLPDRQAAGVGRELFARTFQATGARHRAIIATTDMRAQARYLKAGVYPRFPIQYFSRTPQAVSVTTDLTIEPIAAPAVALEALREVDREVLGHQRDIDHEWLLTDRRGYLYRRDGQPVGYGYLGPSSGPFALLNDADFSAVLAHAETEAAVRGHRFGVEVPLINRAAVDYLLARDYRMDAFFAHFMSDTSFGRFENYIPPSPPFFL